MVQYILQVIPDDAYISSAVWYYNDVTLEGSLPVIPKSATDPRLKACVTLVGTTSTLKLENVDLIITATISTTVKVLSISVPVADGVIGAVTSKLDKDNTAAVSADYTESTKSLCVTLPHVADIFNPASRAYLATSVTATFTGSKTSTHEFANLTVKVGDVKWF